MANGLMAGNVVLDPSNYKMQYTQPIPGYRFYEAAGYVALKPQLGNQFEVWTPSQEKLKPRKRLSIPWGATVYHVGMRFGKGVWSESAQDLTLTLVDGVPNQAAGLHVDRAGVSSNIPFGALDPQPWSVLGPAANLDVVTRTTLLRSARAVNPFNPARLDAFNAPIATQAVAGTGNEDRFDPLYFDSDRMVQLELQCRNGNLPNSPLQPLGLITGSNPGGLRQNPDPKYANQAYILIQVGFYMIGADVVTEDDFAGVVWDEVFANV
jgi:hypothetical protein